MNLALNVGFYNTKVKTENILTIHETRARITTEGINTIKIGKVLYEVGEGTRDITDKATNDVSTICSKYNVLKYGDTNTKLVVALPMNLYLNRMYRESYGQSLLGVHSGIIDGIQKMVNVNECIVYAEGAAAYLKYKSVLKEKLVGLIDIGGNTINCMVFDHGRLNKDSITTLDLGMVKLEREIRDSLNINKTWNVQDYEIRDILETGECSDITDDIINSHIKKIKNELVEKKWNVDRLTMFATGGGSITLKKQLEESFNRIIVSEDGIYDNVDGLYMVAERG